MSRRGSRPRVGLAALAAAVFLTAAPAGAQQAQGSFEQTLSVTGPVDLHVRTGSGSITVTPGPAESVRIVGRIRARRDRRSGLSADEKVRRLEESPPIVQEGNRIRIGDIDDRDLRQNVSISYELVVPPATALVSRSGSGSQEVSGVQGPVEIHTGSGSVRARDIGGEITADTGSGGVDVRAVRGAARIRTGSGSVQALGIGGAVRATTGSGSVELEQTAAGDVEVRTGSGGIRLRGVQGAAEVSTGSGSITVDGQMAGDWSLRAASGSITVRLPGEAGFEMYARTSSGRIESAHPITVSGTISRREIRGTVRGGGPRLEVSTSSGTIRIE